MRGILGAVAFGAALAVAAAGMARPAAAEWPTGPVTMLIGYKAGGGTDTKGRVLAKILTRELGRQVNVINRPGGGQAVALEGFRNNEPNGDMFFFGALTGMTLNPQINSALKYTAEDFTYAGGLTEFQVSMVAPADAPFDDMAGFVTYAKEKGRIKYASLSPGAKIMMQVIANQSGIEVDYIPTKGGRGMVQLVMSGQVDFAYSGGIHARYADRIKTIAAASTKRLGNYPDLPTPDRGRVCGPRHRCADGRRLPQRDRPGHRRQDGGRAEGRVDRSGDDQDHEGDQHADRLPDGRGGHGHGGQFGGRDRGDAGIGRLPIAVTAQGAGAPRGRAGPADGRTESCHTKP